MCKEERTSGVAPIRRSSVENQNSIVTTVEARVKWGWPETQIQKKKVHHLIPEESALLSAIERTPQLQDLSRKVALPFRG
jgi:hypothetical protein